MIYQNGKPEYVSIPASRINFYLQISDQLSYYFRDYSDQILFCLEGFCFGPFTVECISFDFLIGAYLYAVFSV